MEEEITLEYEGVNYSASYIEFEDEVVVYLPDGSQRRTDLSGGMSVRSAAMTHLRGYARALHRREVKGEAPH